MEATFVVNPKEMNAQLMEQMLGFFADKQGPVTVRLSESLTAGFDYQQWFQQMEVIRARTEQIAVPPGIGDLNELIDSINDVDFNQP